MPPEPLPWDRKDFVKERKHERSESASLGFAPRWRDSSSGHYGSSREFPRWGGPNDFRRPPGHGKQGGWHKFAEENAHGYTPYRSGDKILEDGNFRRGDGKYGRNGRDSRSYRDWRGHSWEMNNGSPSMPARLHDVSNDQRSVDDMLMSPSSHPPHSDFVTTWDQFHLKDQHENMKTGGANGLVTGQRGDRENSLDWKPLKWTRSGSLSSRGSGFSHSSSSKSLGGVDSNEGKADLQPKNVTPVQAYSSDAAACVTSAAALEETTSRKKPRLGWGEGLAKYEKKKVEGPDTSGTIVSPNNAELNHSQSFSLADKSPRVLGPLDCASPATPSSVACSSSPGLEEKSFGKAVNVDNDINNLCGSPSVGSQTQGQLDACPFNLEKLDIGSISNLGSSLIEMLQYDDPSSVDSCFVRSTALNKLLIWKGDISKVLEVTETEIDSLENELKSLKSECGSACRPATSSSFTTKDTTEHCSEPVAPSNITRPSLLDVVSCGDEMVGKIPVCGVALEENNDGVKDDEIDSPGTATSKFVEPVCLVKTVSSFDIVKHDDCPSDMDAIQSAAIELKCSVPCSAAIELKCSVPCGNEDEDETAVSNNRGADKIMESKDAPFSGDVNLHMDGEEIAFDVILASNKESACKASEVFNKLLPQGLCKIDFSTVTIVPDASVKENFLSRKRSLRFKERAVTLKFKALQHLWKEDMRLLSIRKHRAKSQKKFEANFRTTHSGCQKHRSSIRSRFTSPAGVSLVPTTEILNFTSKLLSVSQAKLYRDELKMPALILDEKEKIDSRFISSNGLVEDPWAVERERSMINPWTLEEREIFMDKLATFGKDFQKIASFLDHKTIADCVEFYYKNHKSDCFMKIKMGKQSKSSTNYLVSSSKKWNREMNAASLDILGAATVMAADADNAMRSQQMRSRRIFLGGYNDSKISPVHDSILERSSNFDVIGNERETVAADVLAGICGSLSSEAMSSCITTSVDHGEGYREQKCQNVDSAMTRPWTADISQNIEEETCSDESCGEMDPADWTDEEKSLFVRAVSSYGKDFSMISKCVRTRSREQCKVFFSKARKCLGLDSIHPGNELPGTAASDDAHGGGSDAEGACVLETGSIISSDKLPSKMDDNLPVSVNNAKQDGSDAGETINLCSDLNSSEAINNDVPFDQKDSKSVEALVSDTCQMEHGLVADVDKKHGDGICQSESQKASIESINMETEREKANEEGTCFAESMSLDVFDPVVSNPSAISMVNNAVESSGNGSGNDVRGHEPVLNKNDFSGRSFLIQDSATVGTTSNLPLDTGSGTNLSLPAETIHQVSVQLDSVGKSTVVSLPQENSLAIANSELTNVASVQCGKLHNQDRSSSSIDLEERRDKEGQTSAIKDDSFQHLSGHSLVNGDRSSQILRGYPLQIPTKKVMNGDVSCRSLSEVPCHSISERTAVCQLVSQECYLQKCNSSKTPPLVPEHSVLPQHSDQTNGHSRDYSSGSSETEKPCRNGDVKLFGKILSNTSSAQSLNPAHENDEKGTHHPKPSNKSSVLKFAGQQSVDSSNVGLMKTDYKNYLGLQNVPLRSYGFWDGNRIQTGLSSLPDSAVLLAKYPAAFSNYHSSSSKMEQQVLQASVKNNEQHSLNGISIFPPRESNGISGMLEMYRSHEGGPKVQPFTVDMKQKMQPFMVDVKQRQEMFSEMQKRNGFDAISSLQQQGRGMPGMNVIGRGGILGGQCATGVSDPVQAIKMHFAKNDQYSGQNGTMIMEEETWRSNGDVGR